MHESVNEPLEFIGQQEIVDRLTKLIEEARTSVVLVSPYVTLDKLRNLVRVISAATKRGTAVSLVVREPDPSTRYKESSVAQLSELVATGLKLYAVRDLHAK